MEPFHSDFCKQTGTRAMDLPMEMFLMRRYKLKSSENFEEYLKYVEVGLINRKTASAMSPVVMLSRNADGSYAFTMVTALRVVAFSFLPGVEFDEKRADGVVVKSTVVFEGNTMVHTQVERSGRKSKHVRHFTPETLTVITTAEGWPGKCTRVYVHED